MERTKLKTTLKVSLVVGLAALTAACGNGRGVRGYIFDQELAGAITPGVDNRASVQATLGSPTIASTFDENTWYYVSTTVRIRPVFWPDAKEHRVMAVQFSDKGVVADVTNYDLEHMREITPVADKTPTKGKKLNIFQQLFLSVGQFGGAQAPVGSNGGGTPNGG